MRASVRTVACHTCEQEELQPVAPAASRSGTSAHHEGEQERTTPLHVTKLPEVALLTSSELVRGSRPYSGQQDGAAVDGQANSHLFTPSCAAGSSVHRPPTPRTIRGSPGTAHLPAGEGGGGAARPPPPFSRAPTVIGYRDHVAISAQG